MVYMKASKDLNQWSIPYFRRWWAYGHSTAWGMAADALSTSSKLKQLAPLTINPEWLGESQ